MKRIILDALGLSEREHTVLNILQHLPIAQKISKISLQAKLPQSTTSFILRKLEKRKLATRLKSNNHFRWKYRKNIDTVEENSSKTSFMNVITGMNKITHEFLKILELTSGERLYSIQGAAISKSILKKMDDKFLSFFHNAIKKKKIIIEGVIAQSVFSLFKKLSIAQLETHKDRLTIVYILPDEIIQFPLDIFIFQDHVLLVDYEVEQLVHIEDPALALTFKSLFYIAKEYGKKIDLNVHINNLLNL